MLCKFRQNAEAGPMARYLGSQDPRTQNSRPENQGPRTEAPAPATQDLGPGTPRPII